MPTVTGGYARFTRLPPSVNCRPFRASDGGRAEQVIDVSVRRSGEEGGTHRTHRTHGTVADGTQGTIASIASELATVVLPLRIVFRRG